MSLLVDFTIIYQIILMHALKQLILLYLAYIITINMYSLRRNTNQLELQRYRYKVSDYRKRFNNFTRSPLTKLHHKDKYFSYLQYIFNNLILLESAK